MGSMNCANRRIVCSISAARGSFWTAYNRSVASAETIWVNGEFVPWEDAKVHVLTHALHYGTGVFEGIRAYETERGTAIFRHHDHLDRLERSARLYYMELPYPKEELREATHDLIARSGLKSCY